jgi:hypothetical protein
LVRVLIDGTNNPGAVAAGLYTFYDVSDNHTISAQFEKNDSYEVFLPEVAGVQVTPIEGSVSPVSYNGKFKFVVEALEGYTKSIITVFTNGVVLNPVGGVYTISNITADQYVTIEGVQLNAYTIVAKAANGGAISPAGNIPVMHGDSKEFTIIPDVIHNYGVEDVKVNNESQGALMSYTFENIKGDATIIAYFKWGVGIGENDLSIITVFSNQNVVTIDNKDLIPVKQVEIIDMHGRIVWQGQATGVETKIALDVAAGIYNVRIITADNSITTTKVSITK